MIRGFSYSYIILILLLYSITVGGNILLREELVLVDKREDIIQRVFGELRKLLSIWAMIKADEYYHGGLPITLLDGKSCLQEERIVRGEHKEGHDRHAHDHHERHRIEEKSLTLYERIYNKVKVTEHSHLNPWDEKEVLPWFYVAARFDPHNIQAYLLGAYILNSMGRFDRSLEFLKEGERLNPNSASIITSIGEFYYKRFKKEKAKEILERACSLWAEATYSNEAKDDYSKSDRQLAFYLLGDMYMKEGNLEKALELFETLYKLQPDDLVLKKLNEIKHMKIVIDKSYYGEEEHQ